MSLSTRSGRLAIAAAFVLAATSVQAQEAELPMLGRWTGTIRSLISTSDMRNATGGEPGRITGNVELQPVHESGMDLFQVLIRVSSSHAGESLEWGISMGRCGSKLIMIENANQLPPIETRAGGDGEMRHTAAFNLDARHTYQLGLFRNGHSQQNMVACANLKYDERLR